MAPRGVYGRGGLGCSPKNKTGTACRLKVCWELSRWSASAQGRSAYMHAVLLKVCGCVG